MYRLELRLYCENPGGFHATAEPPYTIEQPQKWLKTVAPYLSTLVTILKHAAPLAGPVLGIASDHLAKQLSNEVSLMTELVSQLSDDFPSDPLQAEGLQHPQLDVDYRALQAVLEEVDHSHHWAGLSRILTPEDQVCWLCRDHAQQYKI